MEGSSSSSSLDLSSDLRFRAYAALIALAVVALLAVCFWRLYRLTVSARPQDMLPVSSSSSSCCARGCKAALPAIVHGGAAVECAVCLADLRDGERGRLLPRCGHRFHVECIDRWLRAHSTCPICRAAVGEPGAAEARKGAAVVVPVVVAQA